MYVQLPTVIGTSDKYWHLVIKLTVSSKYSSAILVRAGFSTHIRYDDSNNNSSYSQYSIFHWVNNSTQQSSVYGYNNTPS